MMIMRKTGEERDQTGEGAGSNRAWLSLPVAKPSGPSRRFIEPTSKAALLEKFACLSQIKERGFNDDMHIRKLNLNFRTTLFGAG